VLDGPGSKILGLDPGHGFTKKHLSGSESELYKTGFATLLTTKYVHIYKEFRMFIPDPDFSHPGSSKNNKIVLHFFVT
jgi:hypothetical protein